MTDNHALLCGSCDPAWAAPFRRVDIFEITDAEARRAQGWPKLESRFPPRWDQLLADREFTSGVEVTGRAAAGRATMIGAILEPIREIAALIAAELAN